MARLPESRHIALKNQAKEEAERAFNHKSTRHEIFSSSTRPIRNKLVSLHIGSAVPLKTLKIDDWPSKTEALCLHCAEPCPSAPLPAVKYYDSHEDKYWVYGFFCRPCCSLAHVNEQANIDNSRCLLWTQSVLKTYFNASGSPSPPRAMLKKFGGKLTLSEFYGDDGSEFKCVISPPFVTFAMYAEITHKGPVIDTKALTGLRRPANPVASGSERESTEKTPLILEFLAKRGALKPPAKKSTAALVDEPIKKRGKSAAAEDNGGLARYLMKE